MHNFLKRLELQGFKSFAQKTTLEFPARTTAVVGPNGSGKSNIIDALRWVLGEREVKHLRGATLDNLMFAGTPKRAATGFARVGLWFDNRERLFESDAEEVVVARKIDRTGVSEFLVNDAEVRLRDLVPMLARARLGSRGLTMVGQGQSDVFVKSSPQDRREMIEEVLGLREFRLKKTQAERRLATSEINMDKVQAMLDELSPHLRLLRRQKHRWDKRTDVERELTELENRYFSFRYHNAGRALHDVVAPLEQIGKVRAEKERTVAALEEKIQKIDRQVAAQPETPQLREELSAVLDRRSVVERSLARVEARIEFQEAQLARGTDTDYRERSEATAFIRSVVDELRPVLAAPDLEAARRHVSGTIERLEKFLAAGATSVNELLAAEATKLKTELESLNRDVSRLRAAEEEDARKREELTKTFRAEFDNLERERNELRRLDREVQEKLIERERFQLQLNEVVHEWHTLGRSLESLKAIPSPTELIEGKADLSAAAVADAERRIMRLRGELVAIGEIDEALVREADESEARFEFLSRELDDLKKACADLKRLIKELEEKIHEDFKIAFRSINTEFNNYFRLMFGGGKARLKLVLPKPKLVPDGEDDGAVTEGKGEEEEKAEPEEKIDPELSAGVEVDLSLPRKRITSLDMLSGGERSLVSIAALFSLIAVSPPPFLVLDEIDAPLDEENARRFAELVKEFSSKTQFIIVTHNRATMEAVDVLYGITMGDDGVSKVLSLRLEEKKE